MAETMRVVDEGQMPAGLDEEIRRGLCLCFPADAGVFSRTRAWHGSGPAFSVVVEEGGRVIAHGGIVDRVIRVGGGPVRVAGVQNVFVLPEYRGRGMADRILAVAMGEAWQRGMEVGLLFCLPRLEGIYTRNGWVTVWPERVWATRQGGERYVLGDKNIVMYWPLNRAEFPEGEIDLCGDDW